MKRSHLPILFGVLIGLTAIVYFLLLSLMDLHHNPLYSSVNIIFFGVGQFLLINQYKGKTQGIFKYQDGFWALFKAGIIATLVIAVFFLIYMTELNPGFVKELLTTWEEDYKVGAGTVILGVTLMGFSTSLVFSLTYMQLFKRSWNTVEGKKHTL